MKIEDFKINEKFFGLAGSEWLCTDKGCRTITAIYLDPQLDEAWFAGPPYILEEVVFDEHEIARCYTVETDMLNRLMDRLHASVHPNFTFEDVRRMTQIKRAHPQVKKQYKQLLRFDRVNPEGHILHPYNVVSVEGVLYVQNLEIFARVYVDIEANYFVTLPRSTEDDMKARKAQM